MYKYQKPFWSGALCLGGMFGIGALAVLLWGIIDGWLNLISGAVLVFLLLGSTCLCLLAATHQRPERP